MFYTNADQFINKRDLLQVQIASKIPDLILITEILPKVHNCSIHSTLFALPGYTLYLNFNSDSHDSPLSGIRGVGIFVSSKIQALTCSLSITLILVN